MRTWGIDWSTSAANTAAVCTSWADDGTASIVEVVSGLERARAVELILAAVSADEWVAVDVPFGWPAPFVEVVSRYHDRKPIGAPAGSSEGDRWRKRCLALRATDRHVIEALGVRPLSVAFDRLGATALSWAVVESDLAEHGVAVDRTGRTGRIIETYPKAARVAWNGGVETVLDGSGWLNHGEFTDELPGPGNHVVDALVCSLVARARALGTTGLPQSDDAVAATTEGWIHLPQGDLADLRRGLAPQ